MSEAEQSQESVPAAPPRKSGDAWKWWMAGVLFLATVLTYLDRQTLVFCKKQISTEFGLNNEQYGELLASFRWTYALMQIPAGMMADRFSLRMTYGLAVGLWSLAGGAAVFVFRFPVLMVTRGVLGMGETFNWPCASRIVANTFPPSDRSLASGIFNSGAALGSLIAPTLIGFLALQCGWRAAFLAMGTLGSLWLVLWFVVTNRRSPSHVVLKPKWHLSFRGQWLYSAAFVGLGIGLPAIVILLGPSIAGPIERKCAAVSEAWPAAAWGLGISFLAAAVGGIVWSLVRWRLGAVAFWMLILVTLTVNPCWYFVNEWVIAYLQDSRQLDTLRIAGMVGTLVIATMIFLVADLGNVISGGIIKGLIAYGWSLRAAGIRDDRRGVHDFARRPGDQGRKYALCDDHAGASRHGVDIHYRQFNGLPAGSVVQTCRPYDRRGGNDRQHRVRPSQPADRRYVDQTRNYSLPFILLGLLPLISVAAILVFDSVVHGCEGGVRRDEERRSASC